MDLTLTESGKPVRLKSPTNRQLRELTAVQKQMLKGEVEMDDFKQAVIKSCYPDLLETFDDLPASDTSYLVSTTMQYAHGGPSAVKNSLMSSDGTPTPSEG